MNRRYFLKCLATLPFVPIPFCVLPADNQLHTFGGWFLTDTPGRYEFEIMTGTADDRDAFFNGHTEHKGRGWFVFTFPGELDQASIEAFRSLFGEVNRVYLPVVTK